MTTDSDKPAGLDAVTDRFWELASSSDVSTDGLKQIAMGLSAVLEEIESGELDEARAGALLHGLNTLADALESGRDGDDEPDTDEVPGAGLDQFLGAFRAEAQKRMAGLSISMMGIFNSEANGKAVEQSAGHLHAIRGGAGMLGLESVAGLAGVMEEVILATRRLPPEERDWPVKPLLRGFSLLRGAVEESEIDDQPVLDDAIGELEACLDHISVHHEREADDADDADETEAEASDNPFEETPITDVKNKHLEKRILVVDDVETIAASVGLILSELDIPVDIAANGEEALELLRDHPYSLVISDVMMPRMTGLELTREMRADERLVDIPVILLTSLDEPEEKQEGLGAGANDYIVKGSIGGGELISRVNELLKDAPYVPAVSERPGPRRRVLIAEDTETVAASIAFVLSEGPYDITLAHDGKDAWHKLQGESYDLVISDVQMPSMDGFELIEAIRGDDELEDLPIVLLTAAKTEDTQRRAVEVGADRFLIKGEIGGGRLLQIVSEFLDENDEQ